MKRPILVAFLLTSLFVNVTAQAAGDFVNLSFTGNGVCTTAHFYLPANIKWRVSTTVTLLEVNTINGVSYTVTSTPGLTGSGSGSGGYWASHATWTAAMPYTFVMTITYTEGTTVIGHAQVSGVCNVTGNATLNSSASNVLLNFNDGRCNQEPWQSFAVYPDNKGGFIFYAIHHGVGYYAMHVTEKDLDKNPDTGVNHIIAQAVGVQLWRLQGGLLQAHRIGLDSKDYVFNITCGLMEDGD